VNQIEFSARAYGDTFETTAEVHRFCQEEGIAVTGYGSM